MRLRKTSSIYLKLLKLLSNFLTTGCNTSYLFFPGNLNHTFLYLIAILFRILAGAITDARTEVLQLR